MGGTSYNFTSRSARTKDYATQCFDDTFTQQRLRRMHESMSPEGIKMRECRDNEFNPQTLAIMLGLDITGSMQTIPKLLIGHGLPEMVKKLKGRGVNDPSILFMGLGDSKNDVAPFQVGQFECNDKLLDDWLTTTWIEGNGGGNGGESYLWAWWLAAYHTATDTWEKRGQKGFLFTIGNEPCHPNITKEEFRRVIGRDEESTTMTQLYNDASKRWEIFHLCINNRSDSCPDWKEFMGDRAIVVEDYTQIPDIISNKIAEMVVKSEYKEPKNDYPGVGGEGFKITL